MSLFELAVPGETQAFIQWKNTDVCLDFRCECGWSGHYDGDFAYTLRCGGCERVWEMPSTVRLRIDGRDDDLPPRQPSGAVGE